MGIETYKKRLEKLETGGAGYDRVLVIRMDDQEKYGAYMAGELDTAGCLVVLVERVSSGPVYERPPVPLPVMASPLPPETTERAGDDGPAAPDRERTADANRAGVPTAKKKKDGHDELMAGIGRWFKK